MIPDEEYEGGPAEATAGPGPSWAPRPANGGNAAPMRTAVGGDIPPAGPSRLLAARPPTPPEMRPLNGGGRAFMTPAAGPSENGGGAFAYAPTMASKGNGGSPNVQAQQYQPFGSYTGSSGQGPHQVALSTAPPTITQPPKSGALDMFMAQHQPQQGGGGGQQQGPQQSPGGADEAGAGEAGAAEASAGAAEGGASIVELMGLL